MEFPAISILSPGYTSLVALTVLLLWYTTTAITSWCRLRHIPGPKLGSFSYLWIACLARSGKYFEGCRAVNEKYGHLVRISPNMLATDDPDAIRALSSVKSHAHRDPWYLGGHWDPYEMGMFFNMLEPEYHDQLKARVLRGYSGGEIEALEDAVDVQVQTLLKYIRQKSGLRSTPTAKGAIVDLAEVTSFFTLDVITKVTFGDEFGYMKTDSDVHRFLRESQKVWPGFLVTVEIPWIRKIAFSPLCLKFLGPKKTDATGVGKLMRVGHDAIDQRFASGKDEKDMLGSWIRNGLTQKQCTAEAIFMIVAGSDTTASALRLTMLYMMTNPHVYHKFKQTIAEAIREGRVSSPITNAEAKRIPYLQAIIYEGLRMRPPAPGMYPKSVPPEGMTIDGKFVPGGVEIGINPGSMMHRTEIFGDDVEYFRPERFTEADDVQRAAMERTVELVFGYGRWMCAGQTIAFMELNKAYFELMRAFDFQLLNPTKPWDSVSYSVFVDTNMWVKVTESNATW